MCRLIQQSPECAVVFQNRNKPCVLVRAHCHFIMPNMKSMNPSLTLCISVFLSHGMHPPLSTPPCLSIVSHSQGSYTATLILSLPHSKHSLILLPVCVGFTRNNCVCWNWLNSLANGCFPPFWITLESCHEPRLDTPRQCVYCGTRDSVARRLEAEPPA